MGESYDTMRMFCVLEKDLKPLSIDHECRGIHEWMEPELTDLPRIFIDDDFYFIFLIEDQSQWSNGSRFHSKKTFQSLRGSKTQIFRFKDLSKSPDIHFLVVHHNREDVPLSFLIPQKELLRVCAWHRRTESVRFFAGENRWVIDLLVGDTPVVQEGVEIRHG